MKYFSPPGRVGTGAPCRVRGPFAPGLRLLSLLLFLLLVFPAAPSSLRGEEAYNFPWGSSYKKMKEDLMGQGVALRERNNGEEISFSKGSLHYRYLFFQKRRIESIGIDWEEKNGTREPHFREVLTETLQPEEGRLYAVTLRLSSLPFQGETKEDLYKTLQPLYGTPSESEGRVHFEKGENRAILILESGSGGMYVNRITFLSKSWAEKRNLYLKEFEKSIDQAIQKRLEKARNEGS